MLLCHLYSPFAPVIQREPYWFHGFVKSQILDQESDEVSTHDVS